MVFKSLSRPTALLHRLHLPSPQLKHTGWLHVLLSNVPLAAALAVLAACEIEEHPHVMVWTELGRGQGQAMRVTGDTTLHHSLAIQPHWGVRVDGPIEPRDATAMMEAAASA